MADQIIDTNETVETIYESKTQENEARLREQERDLHDRSISENYRKLFEDSVNGNPSFYVANTVYAPARTEEEVRAPQAPVEEAPTMVRTEVGADNKARIGSYRQPPAPAHARLFEDVTYVKGGYMSGRPAVEEYAAPAAVEEVFAPAAPEEEVFDEAVPTPMTMRHYDPERTAEAQREGVHFWAALSAKTKLLLAAVAAAIVICFMVICINTAVLGSVNADIASRRLELDRLGKAYRQIEDRIEEVTDPENVDNWAVENGMVKD